MKSALNQFVINTPVESAYKFEKLTINDLEEIVAKLPERKEGEDDPYAILLSQEKFEMLVKEKILLAFNNSSPTEKVVSVLYGLPVIIQNIYEFKVMTRSEYKIFYNDNLKQ